MAASGLFYLRYYRYIGICTFILLLSIVLLAFLLHLTDPMTRLPNHRQDPPVIIFPRPPSSPVQGVVSLPYGPKVRVRVGYLSQVSAPHGPPHQRWENKNLRVLSPVYLLQFFCYICQICITATTSAGLEQILPWIFYHKVVGISHFFLSVEGEAASLGAYNVLKSIPGVKLINRTRDLEEKQANSRIWNEPWLAPFFYKPCNYELSVKQTLNMESGIFMAREAGMDWIIHLDTDELMYPAGSQEYSVRKFLSDMPKDVDMVVFPNYESAVERDDIKEPFSEVTMFKKNLDHLPKETYVANYKEAYCGNPDYFLTYGNGKSAARVQDHLRPNGAHKWHNYMKMPKHFYTQIKHFYNLFTRHEIKSEKAAVLHYTYSKFSDLTSRRDRCGCKPTREDIERCFMLDFDRNAFLIASTGTREEMLRWYREHVVWTDREVNLKLLKEGILTRIYTPMIIIKSLRESGVFSSAVASAQETIQTTS